jgi:hypothetical protein
MLSQFSFLSEELLNLRKNEKAISMKQFIETIYHRNEILFYFGLINVVVAVCFFVLTQTTSTQVMGISAWYKPTKFALSTVLYSWAMAWFISYLPSFNTTIFSWSVVVLLGFEVAYIAFQAGRGQLSHYNVSTPMYSALFSMMALAATLVTLYTAYVAVLFFANKFTSLPNYYLWSIRLGLIIFVLFSFEGFVMGSRLSHTVGIEDGSKGIPFLNWSLSHGDLRIAHFIGMHALQVLPLLSLYILKNTKATIFVSILYGLLALFVLIQALNGTSIFKTFNHP